MKLQKTILCTQVWTPPFCSYPHSTKGSRTYFKDPSLHQVKKWTVGKYCNRSPIWFCSTGLPICFPIHWVCNQWHSISMLHECVWRVGACVQPKRLYSKNIAPLWTLCRPLTSPRSLQFILINHTIKKLPPVALLRPWTLPSMMLLLALTLQNTPTRPLQPSHPMATGCCPSCTEVPVKYNVRIR